MQGAQSRWRVSQACCSSSTARLLARRAAAGVWSRAMPGAAAGGGEASLGEAGGLGGSEVGVESSWEAVEALEGREGLRKIQCSEGFLTGSQIMFASGS